MKHHTQVKAYRDESRLFYGACTLCVSVFVVYIYLVSDAVRHVALRTTADTDIILLNTRISELEAEYIESQHAMSNALASQHGFVQVAEKVFVNTGRDSLVLSTN